MTEDELGAACVAIIRKWRHGESQCLTPSERAICKVTMHELIRLVFEYDEDLIQQAMAL